MKRKAKPAKRGKKAKRAAAKPARKKPVARAARKRAARKVVRARAPRRAAAAPKKKRVAAATKPVAAAKKPAVDFERELKRERSTRRRLEKRLTALVQELGQIRHYEVRARVLEEELRRRDEELATFRRAAGVVTGQTELPLGVP